MERGWWYRATAAEKLAQIDAAIELGMTLKQCAMNCGCYREQNFTNSAASTLWAFANSHGRNFDRKPNYGNSGQVWDGENVVSRKQARIKAAREAYLAGDAVDLWSVE